MRFSVIGLVFLLCFQAVFSQDLATLELSQHLSLLNGRASMDFPAFARIVPSRTGMASQDLDPNQTTRIFYDQGRKRLIFFAKELYYLSTPNVLEEIISENPPEYRSEVLLQGKTWRAIYIYPTQYDIFYSKIFVGSMMVITEDHSMFSVDAFITPEAIEEGNEYRELVKRVFQTLVPGDRLVNRRARTETLQIFGSPLKYEIDVPEDYALVANEVGDSLVFRFEAFLPYSDTTWGTIAFYTERDAALFYEGYGFKDPPEVIAGKFLGQEVDWLLFKETGREVYLMEQVVEHPDLQGGLKIHVVITANYRPKIDEFSQVVSGIRLVE